MKRGPAILTAIIIFVSTNSWASPQIRVLVLANAPKIDIFSACGLVIRDMTTNKKEQLNAERAGIVASGRNLIINSRPYNWQTVEVAHGCPAEKDGLIWLNSAPYSGDLAISSNSASTLSAINIVPLEKYVEGIIAGEIPGDWPIEAMKAQSVAARTYALYMRTENGGKTGYDLKSTVEDQVYKGNPQRQPKIREAVEGTTGEILAFHDKPIKARFHSSCGGQTETSIHVWGEKDISRSINDPYCKNSPHNRWRTTLSSQEISKRLRASGFDPGYIDSIQPEAYEHGGRIAAVAIHGSKQTISLTGNDFRRYLGFDKIKSTRFSVSKTQGGFSFSGSGFGHGVGMCQWGAKGMAEHGYSYRDILNHYYPGTAIKKTY